MNLTDGSLKMCCSCDVTQLLHVAERQIALAANVEQVGPGVFQEVEEPIPKPRLENPTVEQVEELEAQADALNAWEGTSSHCPNGANPSGN
jgi:hypothetical protein